MKGKLLVAVSAAGIAFGSGIVLAGKFGLAEHALNGFRSVEYENTYTVVPSSGKLVAIKVTDSGKVFYICKEETGYVIYHLEIRASPGMKEKIDAELAELGRKWETVQQDELLLTKERLTEEFRKRINRYCDAVWVRNAVILEGPRAERESTAGR